MSSVTHGTVVNIGYVPSILSIGNLHGKPFIQFHPDGTVALAPGARPDDAARVMMALVASVFAAHCGQLRGQVRAFRVASGVNIPATPTVPSNERVRLCARLIAEEALETISAMFADESGVVAIIGLALLRFINTAPVHVDMVAFADGCADLDYATESSRQEFGVDGGPIAAEVHRSNMEKLSSPMREDGKATKPPGWDPPDVAGELRKQGWNP